MERSKWSQGGKRRGLGFRVCLEVGSVQIFLGENENKIKVVRIKERPPRRRKEKRKSFERKNFERQHKKEAGGAV